MRRPTKGDSVVLRSVPTNSNHKPGDVVVIEKDDHSPIPYLIDGHWYSERRVKWAQGLNACPDSIHNQKAAEQLSMYEAYSTGELMNENDPNGIDQHTPGAKLDNGKPRVALVLKGFARALWKVAEVGTFGANKYSDNGWKEVENGQERYADAGMRHFLKEALGEELDPDSNLEHLAHQAWNALAVLEFELKKKGWKP